MYLTKMENKLNLLKENFDKFNNIQKEINELETTIAIKKNKIKIECADIIEKNTREIESLTNSIKNLAAQNRIELIESKHITINDLKKQNASLIQKSKSIKNEIDVFNKKVNNLTEEIKQYEKDKQEYSSLKWIIDSCNKHISVKNELNRLEEIRELLENKFQLKICFQYQINSSFYNDSELYVNSISFTKDNENIKIHKGYKYYKENEDDWNNQSFDLIEVSVNINKNTKLMKDILSNENLITSDFEGKKAITAIKLPIGNKVIFISVTPHVQFKDFIGVEINLPNKDDIKGLQIDLLDAI